MNYDKMVSRRRDREKDQTVSADKFYYIFMESRCFLTKLSQFSVFILIILKFTILIFFLVSDNFILK